MPDFIHSPQQRISLMLCRLSITCVVIAAAIVVDGQTAEAQGLFRRIQSRIQSRIQASPPFQPPQTGQPQTGQPQTGQPQRQPQYTPQVPPGSKGQQPGLQPRRVRPVTPNSQPNQPTPAARPIPAQPRQGSSGQAGTTPPRTLPGSPNPARQSRTTPDPSATVGSNKFGGSILAPAQRTVPAQPARPVAPRGELAESQAPALNPAPLPSE